MPTTPSWLAQAACHELAVRMRTRSLDDIDVAAEDRCGMVKDASRGREGMVVQECKNEPVPNVGPPFCEVRFSSSFVSWVMSTDLGLLSDEN